MKGDGDKWLYRPEYDAISLYQTWQSQWNNEGKTKGCSRAAFFIERLNRTMWID